MSSIPHGGSTLVEVTHIDGAGGREYHLAFREFPWFRDARISEVLHVELEGPDHLRWPDLDVDLSLDSIEHPVSYPLVYH